MKPPQGRIPMKRSEELKSMVKRARTRNKAVSAVIYILCDVIYVGSVLYRAFHHVDTAYDVTFYILITLAALMLTGLNFLSYKEATRHLDRAEKDIRQLEENEKQGDYNP
jgi:uncharacterized membrane protein YbjE (DUF340 family)